MCSNPESDALLFIFSRKYSKSECRKNSLEIIAYGAVRIVMALHVYRWGYWCAIARDCQLVCSGSYVYIGGGGTGATIVCSGSYMYIGGGGTGATSLQWLLCIYRWWGYS